MSTNNVDGALDVFKGVIDKLNNFKSYTQSTSLLDVTKVSRVEPLCLLDSDCLNFDNITDVLYSTQSIFSGYYLQAVALMGTTINGVSVAKKLEPLNPKRSIFSLENFAYKLPSYGNHVISFEDEKNSEETCKLPSTPKPQSIGLVGNNLDVTQSLVENQQLSVGKMYNVQLTDGNAKVNVPVAIRLLVNTIPSSVLVNVFSSKSYSDYDLKERWHDYRSGKLSFWKDLVFCNDLIDKSRSTLIKDKTGISNTIGRRDVVNKALGLFTKNPSLATASNIAVISTDTQKSLEFEMGGKLSSFKIRNTLFNNTNLMILVVIDKGWNRVTYYYRGIEESSNVSVKEIKSGNTDDNTLDFMKAFLQGSAAAL